jgi:peptidoglycan/LPS O-acetylase OafA/YrhL
LSTDLSANNDWKAGLEALRGIAALSVVLFHCIGLLPWNVAGTPAAFFRIGWIGVDVFFVISGYVITASAVRQHGTPGYASRFWRARLARILPLYYVTTLFFLLAVNADALQKQGLFQILTHLTLTHHFFQDTAFSINGVTWSLSVEMQFYVLAFLGAPLLVNVSRKKLAVGFLLLLVGVLVYRVVVWHWLRSSGASEAAFMHALSQAPALLDSFAFGALVFLFRLRQPGRAQSLLLALLALVLLMVSYAVFAANAAHYWTSPLMAIGFRSVIALFAVVALLAALSVKSSRVWWPLLELGKISYGIYLWHLCVLFLVQRHVPVSGTAAVVLVLAITLVLAKLSHYLIEAPCMRSVYAGRAGQWQKHHQE